jgi:NitT/TauT family transport system substrate-binding protein
MRGISTTVFTAAAILSLGAVTACGSSSTPSSSDSGGTATIKLGLVQGQDFTHAMPAQIAAAQGIFTKHQLNVQIVSFSAGSDLVKAMAGGSIDVGEATGLDIVSAAATNIDLKAFYGTAAATPMAVIVKSGSTVHTLPDLKGKSVGISKFGSLTDFVVRLIAQKSGLGAKDIKAVPLGAPSANTAALSKGDVDAIVLPVGFAYSLQASGTPVTALRVADLTSDSQFAVLAASGAYLNKNKAAVTRLTVAYSEAIKYLQGQQAATVALAVSKLGMKQEVATKTYQELAKDFTADGKISTAGLKAYADQLPALAIAPKSPAESAYYDPQFTPVGS